MAEPTDTAPSGDQDRIPTTAATEVGQHLLRCPVCGLTGVDMESNSVEGQFCPACGVQVEVVPSD